MSKISAFLTIKDAHQRRDTYLECIRSALNFADEVVVIDGGSSDGSPERIRRLGDRRIRVHYYPWPEEFEWAFIGEQFQRGYLECTGDWVVHLDADYIIHEEDAPRLRQAFEQHATAPALSFWKYQFIRADRYSLKSRLVVAANKGKFGRQISFTGGHDLCAPALNGTYLSPDDVPEARVPFYNYDWLRKTKQVATRDLGRFARAYQRSFGKYKLGGPDDASALREFTKMQYGRAEARATKRLKLEEHPLAIQATLQGLEPVDFGYDGWGRFPKVPYAD